MSALLMIVGAVVLILLMAWRGWRLGIIRQALSIAALVLAYGAGLLFGRFLIPFLRPFDFPDRILAILGGVIVGMIVYIGLNILSGLVFKRTSHQSLGVIRFGFGISGAVLGAAFGIVLVMVAAIRIRIVGSVAEAETYRPPTVALQNPLAVRLARMKQSLTTGLAGRLIERVDPVPAVVYDTLGKVSRLTANPESMDRFTSDRGVQQVAAHPKVVALGRDPDVSRALREGDVLSLLRHPKVISAANDPEVMRLIMEFDLQKALDQSLRQSQNPPARDPRSLD